VRPSRAGNCHAFSENALKLYSNAQIAAIRRWRGNRGSASLIGLISL
jgi:hypothetical protein